MTEWMDEPLVPLASQQHLLPPSGVAAEQLTSAAPLAAGEH